MRRKEREGLKGDRKEELQHDWRVKKKGKTKDDKGWRDRGREGKVREKEKEGGRRRQEVRVGRTAGRQRD